MPNTFVPIATTTVGAGGAASIVFSSIPSTYNDLAIMWSIRSTRAFQFDSAQIRMNGDTAANYVYRDFLGEGGGTPTSSSQSGRGISDRIYIVNVAPAANATSNVFGNIFIYLPNYISSQNKTVLVNSAGEAQQSAQGDANMVFLAGQWNSSSVINSITLAAYSANMAQYSSATLYGIQNS